MWRMKKIYVGLFVQKVGLERSQAMILVWLRKLYGYTKATIAQLCQSLAAIEC